ncbi:META domain-containing protein [Colwellia echini]|uniref:META domain-containing protein n=1 Tax=Colwellia echini TaxID=1982103 RepID=A0ABY3MUT3_9GAMM|nr:META domain-containing protein [Colwellia echini]TYK64884.1 META domain-containing protein [Colwellia echini]
MKNNITKLSTKSLKSLLLLASLSTVLTACSNNTATLPLDEELPGMWTVESINDSPTIKDSKVDLKFTAENQLSGSASCNNFSTGYTIENNTLTIGQMAVTRKMCLPALMDQESSVLQALSKVKRFALNNGQLSLFDQQGVVQLKARRTKS